MCGHNTLADKDEEDEKDRIATLSLNADLNKDMPHMVTSLLLIIVHVDRDGTCDREEALAATR